MKPFYIILSILAGVLFCSCHNYYKVASVKGNAKQLTSSIDSIRFTSRYFILRNGNESYRIRTMRIKEDKTSALLQLEEVQESHSHHITSGHANKYKFKKESPAQNQVINEVHVYIPHDTQAKAGNYLLDFNKVSKMEILQKDKGRTAVSYVIGAVGYTVGALAVVGAIIAATKSSCPFVSGYEDGQFTLQGEIFGGAIYPQLARYDYLPLRMEANAAGTLQLKISNELKEHQFTDFADLLVISHPNESRPVPDAAGTIHMIKNPVAPARAVLNGRKDIREAILTADDYQVVYMNDHSQQDGINTVQLSFCAPQVQQESKLILKVKNSYWLDLLYGKLAEGLGSHYTRYAAQQKKKSAAAIMEWVKQQQIPLRISVRNHNEWSTVEELHTVGPLALREMVIPLPAVSINDSIHVQISSGFMFWEIDYAAIEYASDDDYRVAVLKPVAAFDENHNDVLPALLHDDGIYLSQPDIGNIATITYEPAMKDDGRVQSYVLKTKGYYQHIRSFENRPQRKFLKQFEKANALSKYGMQFYHDFQQLNSRSLSSNTFK